MRCGVRIVYVIELVPVVVAQIQIFEVVCSVNTVLPYLDSIEIELHGLVSNSQVCVITLPSDMVSITVIQFSIYLIIPGSYHIYSDFNS